jgi:hypothetical protein
MDGWIDKWPQLDKIEQRAKADVEILKAELFRSSYDLRSVPCRCVCDSVCPSVRIDPMRANRNPVERIALRRCPCICAPIADAHEASPRLGGAGAFPMRICCGNFRKKFASGLR